MLSNKLFLKFSILALSVMIVSSCERELSDKAVLATFPSTPDIFTDNFVGLGEDFFFPYNDGFAKAEVLSVDNEVSYLGTSSMRIDVPQANDPDGSYVGAFFRSDAGARDLSRFDALTFWAKATKTSIIENAGFGQDDEQSKHQVSISNLQIDTSWRKYTIPIPDPSKLTNEKGMFWLVAIDNEETSYTIWFDEIKFENLGTIGQPRPRILGGQDQNLQGNIDTSFPIVNLSQVFNLGNGQDVTVNLTPAYFDFETSNPFVAQVNENGIVNVVGPGELDPETGLIDNTAKITASVGGVPAMGSMNIEAADTEIISIFSDIYANVPVDNYNGFYNGDGQTTQGGAPPLNEDGNNVIVYTELNFVAIEFYGREGSDVEAVDLTETNTMHIDIRVDQPLNGSESLNIELFNNFATNDQTSGVVTLNASDFQTGNFVSFDIPLSDFNGLTTRDEVGAIIFSTGGIPNLSLDNIYFYNNN